MNKALQFIVVPVVAFGAVVVLGGAFMLIGTSFDFSPAPAKPKVDPASEARFQLAVAALRAIKKSAKDPDSVKFEDVLVDDAGKLVCVTYRAKNSFAAVVPGHSVFTDKGTYHDDEKAWNKHCANKPLNNMKSARRAV